MSRHVTSLPMLGRVKDLKLTRRSEGRLHETMYEMAGESHKFAKFASGSEPASVLDVSWLAAPVTFAFEIGSATRPS